MSGKEGLRVADISWKTISHARSKKGKALTHVLGGGGGRIFRFLGVESKWITLGQ